MNDISDYYVYVYIDTRNFEEFYYGKGTGDRKYAHLGDEGDSEKAKRIKDIHKSGLKPIIKVIAKDLTEREAFLIEKTLIWKLGRTLTNVSSGHFAEKFRPHNTMHTNLYGFDNQNRIYFFNVGESPHRTWVDCRKYGFLSAGQGKIWGEQTQALREGDVVVAYLSKKGYVGVGVVIEEAVIAKDFRINRKRLDQLNLVCKRMMENASDPEKAEYPVRVEWKASCDASEAKWTRNRKLFTARMARASLQNQRQTMDFISLAFNIDLGSLLKKEQVIGE
ncbi:MAG: GIY-YIG nuclease family protein [Anaerolineales bacterium]